MLQRVVFAFLIIATALCCALPASAASSLEGKVIINEWGQASSDWVEILVTQTADLRGMWVCDSGGPDSLNGLELSTTNTLWAAVPAGTLIVFYDGAAAPAEDFDVSDYKLVMNVGTFTDPSLFDATNNHFKAFSAGTATDNPRLFDKDLVLIHDWDQLDDGAFTGSLRASAAGDGDAFTSNTAIGVSNAANWSKVSGGGTPGQPNGGANTTWIASMHTSPLPDPAIAVVPTTLNFNSIDSGATTSETLTITNNGATKNLIIYATTTLSGVNPSKFSLLTSLPLTLTPGTSTTLRVAFNPAGTTGTLTAQLNIASNNDSANTFTTVTLTGAATSQGGGSSLQGKVIINEWGQDAAGDWIEILVTQTADLRGLWVCDSGGPDAANGLQFSTTNAFWTAVPAGTLIVFYDGIAAPAEDFDISDYNLIMNVGPTTDPSLFDSVNNHFKAFSSGAPADNPRLFDKNLALLHDWDQNDDAGFTGALRASLSGDVDVYSGDTATDISNPANWLLVTTGATPAQPNGGANTSWIVSLRNVPPSPNAAHGWTMFQ